MLSDERIVQISQLGQGVLCHDGSAKCEDKDDQQRAQMTFQEFLESLPNPTLWRHLEIGDGLWITEGII